MSILLSIPAAVQSDPTDLDPTDHAEPVGPDPEDAEWWADVVDHTDWPLAGELSPDEEEAELFTLDLMNERAELVASWDRYEAGYGW